MSGYGKQILITSTIMAVIVLAIGLGIYYATPRTSSLVTSSVQTNLSNITSITSSSSSTLQTISSSSTEIATSLTTSTTTLSSTSQSNRTVIIYQLVDPSVSKVYVNYSFPAGNWTITPPFYFYIFFANTGGSCPTNQYPCPDLNATVAPPVVNLTAPANVTAVFTITASTGATHTIYWLYIGCNTAFIFVIGSLPSSVSPAIANGISCQYGPHPNSVEVVGVENLAGTPVPVN